MKLSVAAYPAAQHKFVHNIFSLTTEADTTPLLGLRLLRHLDDAKFQRVDGSFRYVSVADLTESFAEMGVPARVVGLWLDAMLKCGLCQNYDPTTLQVAENGRVEITSAGHQHLVWAPKEWVYIEAMMEVTPVRDAECFAQMENLSGRGGKTARLKCLRLFLEYLIDEDAKYCRIPADQRYASQAEVIQGLRLEAAEKTSYSRPPEESKRFGVCVGEIVEWNAQWVRVPCPAGRRAETIPPRHGHRFKGPRPRRRPFRIRRGKHGQRAARGERRPRRVKPEREVIGFSVTLSVLADIGLAPLALMHWLRWKRASRSWAAYPTPRQMGSHASFTIGISAFTWERVICR